MVKNVLKLFMLVMVFALSLHLGLDQTVEANRINEETALTHSAGLKMLVEQLAVEGEIVHEGAVRALTMHVTAVDHFEKQGDLEKVIKHLKGFRLLLTQHRENEWISETAYSTLESETDAITQEMSKPPNLIPNPGFESTNDGIPVEWQAMGDEWNSNILATSVAARTGNFGLMIHTDTTNNPWVAIPIPVEAGATYEISSWYQTIDVSGSVGYKIEYFKGLEKTSENWVTGSSPSTRTGLNDGEWHEFKYETVAPPEAKYLYIYLRLYGTGTVYFDDIVTVKTVESPQLDIQTDHVFYYPDITSGTVSVEITPNDGDIANNTVDIQIVSASDGTQIFNQSGMIASENVTTTFNPVNMALREPYRLIVQLKDNMQQVIERAESEIYRWERPGTIPENGPIMVDDEPFFPVIAYHARVEDYPSLSEIGVNTVQGGNTSNPEVARNLLDSAHAHGLKMLMPLYNDMKVQENYELTRQMVTQFKDHPALLGYMIMDEPTTNGIAQTELIDAYELIRSIDSEHPTYIVEADQLYYQSTGQATDILVTDVYPYSKNSTMPIREVGDSVRKAIADVNDVKPVWTILQTFKIPGTNWDTLPTIDQLRNMGYQAFLAGTKGFGFYSINDPGWKLQESELWPGMVKFKDEINFMSDLFVNGNKISQHTDNPVQWGIWEKDNEKYVVAINVTQDPQTVTISLDQVGYQVEQMYGSNLSEWANWDAGLTINLGPEHTSVYKITSFADQVHAASSELQEVEDAVSHEHWIAQTSDLIQGLQNISQLLEADSIQVEQTIDRALAFLSNLSQLQSWLDQQTDDVLNGKRQILNETLGSAQSLVMPIVQSIVRFDLQVSSADATPGDTNFAALSMQNVSHELIENVHLQIDWPESFSLAPFTKNVGDLAVDASDTSEVSFIIPGAIQPEIYPIQATVSYTYKGIELSTTATELITVNPLLSAKLTPNEMTLNQPGTYPFSVELTNHSGRSVEVELIPVIPSGIIGELPQSVTLAANDRNTVNGQMSIPAPLVENDYPISIEVHVNGTVIETLSLNVHVDLNLVNNGGFEKEAASSNQPDGWQMRASVWDKSVFYSGLASVRLDPDPTNSFHVVNSSVPSAIPVTPGKTYKLQAWIKNSATEGLVSLGARQADANSVTITYTWADTQLNSDWTLYEVSFTALPQAKTAWVYFKLDPDANGSAWIDDVELVEVE